MMRADKLFVIFLFFVFLIGCEVKTEEESKVLYFPYYERCAKDLDLLLNFLGDYNLDVKVDVLMHDTQLVRGDIFNGLIKVKFPLGKQEDLQSSFNRYLFDCGPNAQITTSSDSLDETAVRRSITRAINLNEPYEGSFFISLEGSKATIYFSRDLQY